MVNYNEWVGIDVREILVRVLHGNGVFVSDILYNTRERLKLLFFLKNKNKN